MATRNVLLTRILAVAACVTLLLMVSGDDESPDAGPQESSTSEVPTELEREPAPAQESPDSVHVLVNKQNPLSPRDYAPDDLRNVDAPHEFADAPLREEAAGAYEELHAAAAEEGIDLWATTAYRDGDFQETLYEQRRLEDGPEAADRVSARPGHSEHQTGLAVDVADLQDRECYLHPCFGDSEQGRWLADHAYESGFIIRYPEGAEAITGFAYEPWHLRYLGTETAQEVHESGLTLEEFWDRSPAPDYAESYEPDDAESSVPDYAESSAPD
ncbi:M15 family metallopeptidase [Nesterenkonia halotolerans]|uniref:D-alanyl-D-alanine carboxypeptidase n=1 Tax=Nesterenkonia halotolerans TaxID=225325 RepID=A0ABR9J549_9MICC|nr:M15 family metallopeptidase [Nesterenkonia halotolerans]MBE1514030.1 D-alanyl-D-alanine carboxypeptidase [Nesterenkonia halotolerans]